LLRRASFTRQNVECRSAAPSAPVSFNQWCCGG
jgi:hypothetical protein